VLWCCRGGAFSEVSAVWVAWATWWTPSENAAQHQKFRKQCRAEGYQSTMQI